MKLTAAILKYLYRLLFFALVLTAALFLTRFFLDGKLLLSDRKIVFLAIFFYCTTAFLHIISANAGVGRPAAFVRTFMAALAIKLLVYLMVLVVIWLINRSGAIHFTIAFLAMYFAFALYEAFALISFFKQQKQESAPTAK